MSFFEKYPQNIWASQVIKMLRSEKVGFDKIIDAPCGNGFIARKVAEAMPNNEVLAIDINEKQLNSKYLNPSLPNLKALKEDLFVYNLQGKNNAWLFINSMYCLPNAKDLIDSFGQKTNVIIAVFPNVRTNNFKTFERNNPDFENPSKMSIEETIEVFQQCHFKVVEKKECVGVAFHKWQKTMNRLHVPLPIKNFIFTTLDICLPFLNKEYFIVKFKRDENNTSHI